MKIRNKTKRKVTISISEEEIFLFQTFFMFGSPCEKHRKNYDVNEIKVCNECKINKGLEADKLIEIGLRLFIANGKKYYKMPKLSKKEKQLLKIIKSKDKDIILFEKAILQVGESLGIKDPAKTLEKFDEMGELCHPREGLIDTPKNMKDDPWKNLPEADSSEKVIKLNENQLALFKIIKKEMNTGLDMIPKEDILFLAGKNGFNKKTTLKILESLQKSGDLYKPRKDFYKPTKTKKVN